jgi:hypothetical protein
VEYLTTGFDEKNILRDTKNHIQVFVPSMATSGGINLGRGIYARGISGFQSGSEVVVDDYYEYEVRPGVTAGANFLFTVYKQDVRLGGYYTRGTLAVEYDAFYGILTPLTSPYYIRVNDTIACYGNRPEKGSTGVSVGFGFSGRIDVAGRSLHDAILVRFSQKSNTESYLIDPSLFTREKAEFYPLNELVVTKTHTCVLLGEVFFRPGLVEVGKDYRPKFWLVTTPNTEAFGALAYADLTSTIFSGARVPDPSTSGPDTYYGVTSGRQYGIDLSVTIGSMRTAVVSDDAFLISWQQRMPDGWRQRVAKVSLTGGAVSSAMVYESADNTQALTPFWQNIVHIGNGVVLAKIASGWPGEGYSITFIKSTDGGETWGSPFIPAGLDSPMLNQYHGNFMVDKALSDDKPGLVLLPSWNPGSQAYHVYESKDAGIFWTRRGQIYKPITFQRVDTMLVGDGGGNFDDLLPGPSPARLPDVTLPTRYKDRP